ncbi:MAG: pyrroline-5-carboxylate reductase family protein [Candidatus Bathycorpusculaceae bacterium]
MKKVTFIGTGKMGGALLERLLNTGFVSKEHVLACDINENRLKELRQKLGVNISNNNKEGAKFGDVVIIAVMPKQVREILEEIKTEISKSKLVVSVAALVSTGLIEKIFMKDVGVIRIMPNIPSLVGSGFNLVSFGNFVKDKDKERIRRMLSVWGEYREVPEEKMELYTVISAMGPTYFFPFLDTLVSFGVENGLSESEAREAACLTLEGTAAIALKVPVTIENLKNMIGSQPLKDKEQELKATLREALNKTLNELRTISKKMA